MASSSPMRRGVTSRSIGDGVMLGYPREELLKLSWKDLIPAEDRVGDPLRWDDLRTGKTALKEHRLRRKDGQLLPVEISARVLTDGGLLGLVRDDTERKRAQAALRESEERFAKAFEVSRYV